VSKCEARLMCALSRVARDHNRPRLRSATARISRMYCPRLRSDDACVMAERSRGHCSQRKTRCPSAVEGQCQVLRTKGEVRRTKDEITKYKLRSTVAAPLLASGRGASISHTCPAPLSFWRGAGGEAYCSNAKDEVRYTKEIPSIASHDYNLLTN
jgi:hypothetical protein